jgi:hypothetical protein
MRTRKQVRLFIRLIHLVFAVLSFSAASAANPSVFSGQRLKNPEPPAQKKKL